MKHWSGEPYKSLNYPPLQTLCLMAYVSFLLIHGEAVDYAYCSANDVNINRMFAYPVFVAVMYLLWQTSTLDPGAVSKDNIAELTGALSATDTDDFSAPTDSKYCEICDILRPVSMRIIHCKPCGYCVAAYDHHCGVIGRCVGRHNRAHFVSVLGLIMCGHVLAALACFCRGTDFEERATRIWEQFLYRSITDALRGAVSFVYDYWLFAFYCYLGAAISLFFAFHAYLYLIDSSTYECIKGYNKGSKSFCSPGDRCISVCGMRAAAFVASLHKGIDFRGNQWISPSSRFLLFTIVLGIPFGGASIHALCTATNYFQFIWGLCSLGCTVVALYWMHVVITQRPAYLEYTFNEDAGSMGRSQFFFCKECDASYIRQDHHCGLFGTCIHKYKR